MNNNNPFIPALVFTYLLTIVILIACDDTPTGPEEPPPGRRDYVWEVHKINKPNLYYTDIWGSDTNNVWVVSLGSPEYNVIHFDGEKWEHPKQNFMYDMEGVWGYEDKVWTAAKRGRIYKFENENFTSELDLPIDESKEFIVFFDIAGKNENEIFSVGVTGYFENGYSVNPANAIIYNYNGNGWKEFYKYESFGGFTQIKYSSRRDRYYLSLSREYDNKPDTVGVFEFDGKKLKKIYIGNRSDGTTTINTINDEIYLKIGNTFYEYDGGFNKILTVNDEDFGGQVWGRNKNDLFIRMQHGIIHYNGNNLEYIVTLSQNQRPGSSAVVFENQIFFVVVDYASSYNYIYRGKLKKEN